MTSAVIGVGFHTHAHTRTRTHIVSSIIVRLCCRQENILSYETSISCHLRPSAEREFFVSATLRRARPPASRCRYRRPRCRPTLASPAASPRAAHSTARSAVTAATPAARTTGRVSCRRTPRTRRRCASRGACPFSIS